MKSSSFWIIIIEAEENYKGGLQNNSQQQIINKILKIQSNETVLEDSKEKDWVIYKNRFIKITPDYLIQIFKIRRDWKEYSSPKRP